MPSPVIALRRLVLVYVRGRLECSPKGLGARDRHEYEDGAYEKIGAERDTKREQREHHDRGHDGNPIADQGVGNRLGQDISWDWLIGFKCALPGSYPDPTRQLHRDAGGEGSR